MIVGTLNYFVRHSIIIVIIFVLNYNIIKFYQIYLFISDLDHTADIQ